MSILGVFNGGDVKDYLHFAFRVHSDFPPPPHQGVGAPILWLQNMKSAEEDLYSKWKEMTLNSGGEDTK